MRLVMVMVMATATALAACADSGQVFEPGVLEHYGDSIMIDVPTTATLGEPMSVSVTTYGGGCVQQGRTDVDVTADGADVFPFDRRFVGEGTSCTLILYLFVHETTLTFDTPGTKSVRVHGRRVDLDVDEDIRIDFSVVVE